MIFLFVRMGVRFATCTVSLFCQDQTTQCLNRYVFILISKAVYTGCVTTCVFTCNKSVTTT